ncbi:MAG: hypothetical protein WCE90_12085 [Candidatus Zixiibacteriota bacterium]
MRKQIAVMAVVLGVLLASWGPCYSGWGPRAGRYGLVVIEAHPWGEEPHTTNVPSCDRRSPGGDLPSLISVPALTNFTVQFYLKHVVKKAARAQSSVKARAKSD